MQWEIEIRPLDHDSELGRVREEYFLMSDADDGGHLLAGTAKGYVLTGDVDQPQAEQLVRELLVDPLVERGSLGALGELAADDHLATVLLKPGVMDPVAMSVIDAASDAGITLDSVRTFRRYYGAQPASPEQRNLLFGKVLCNDAIEQIVDGPLRPEHLGLGSDYHLQIVTVPLRDLDDDALTAISRNGQLSLSLDEMREIQKHYRAQERDPTDVELETLAQTWSEHCSHKTLKGCIDFDGRRYDNLLKETIFAATQQLREQWGSDDWCVSVFEDNAGVVAFDNRFHACFKVETHNRPSAIEPYGGASTGIGGVIRDPLGTGLGAKPVCSTDVFCFASPDYDPKALPPGVLHPRRIMNGVVAGVRDYGNRMGIPTVNGAVLFDDRYLANPLVFCGTVGIIPVDRAHKEVREGDLIVAVGGRTGRDGIHGATFSSAGLTSESEKISGGAVQIGNAITEKKMLDVILHARDLGLYNAITDCGAGGFSSAVGEMGAELGALVHLDKAPLKYEGLSYTEIWISEAQERMILSVSPEHWPALHRLCANEDVEATVIGHFEKTGRLRLFYREERVADLDMEFLHEGRPKVVRQATWRAPSAAPSSTPTGIDFNDTLLKLLSSLNVCSKESIIRQYDHEVQGGSVIKPLVGIANDGPSDAAVITPVVGSTIGLAIGCGINPHYGDHDPYRMAAAAIDEAVRNVVAVGADPARIALLDNFCWGNTDRPDVLGSLVRAAEACRDVALAYRMPFISGKDSLKNEMHAGDFHIVIPPTLLISAMGRVPDVRKCVSMDLKEPGNELFLVGAAKNEMGGSHFNLIHGIAGGDVPMPDLETSPLVFAGVHRAIERGLARSCHDLSEGGLGVALAETAFAGGVGVDVTIANDQAPAAALFSETASRFLVEVCKESVSDFRACFDESVPIRGIGVTIEDPIVCVRDGAANRIISQSLDALKTAWQSPLAS